MAQKIKLGCNEIGDTYTFQCPGCNHGHVYYVGILGMSSWSFNGNMQSPSFNPSLLNKGSEGDVCHLFVKDGKIIFCSDSTHHLKGKTVEMKDVHIT